MCSEQAFGCRFTTLSKTGLWPFAMAALSLCRMILSKPIPLDAITKVRICIWYIEKAINGTSWENNRSMKYWFSSNLTPKKPRLNSVPMFRFNRITLPQTPFRGQALKWGLLYLPIQSRICTWNTMCASVRGVFTKNLYCHPLWLVSNKFHFKNSHGKNICGRGSNRSLAQR